MIEGDITTEYIPPDWYDTGTYQSPYPEATIGNSYVDPVFGGLDSSGSTITTATDAITDGVDGWASEYPGGSSNFNSGTIAGGDLYMRVTETVTAVQKIIDVSDYSVVRSAIMGSASPSDYWWHWSDPEIIYAVEFSPGKLWQQNVVSGTQTEVTDFTGYARITGFGESNLITRGSKHYLALDAPDDEKAIIWCFEDEAVVAELDYSGISGFFDATLSGAGEYLIVADFSIASGFWRIFDSNIDTWVSGSPVAVTAREGPSEDATRYVFDANHPDGDYKGAGHKDVTVYNGNSLLIYMESNFTNNLYAIDCAAGTRTKILNIGFFVPSPKGVHVCCNSTDLNGMAILTIYQDGGTNIDPSSTWSPLHTEVIRTPVEGPADGTGTQRLFHTRTDTTGATLDASAQYWCAPKAQDNDLGTIGMFGSNHRRQRDDSTPLRFCNVFTFDIPGQTPAVPSDGSYRLRIA